MTKLPAFLKSNSSQIEYKRFTLSSEANTSIMLIEPDSEDRNALTDEIAELGFRAIPVASKNQALELIDASMPDLILLSLSEPTSFGLAVLRELKVLSNCYAQVVVMLDLSNDSLAQTALDMGADDLLPFGFPSSLLFAKVKQLETIKSIRQEMFNAISEYENTNKLLQDLATIDPITKLANKKCFEEILHKEYRRAARDNKKISLMYLQFANYKDYLDHYGTEETNNTLVAITTLLQGCVKRASDTIARVAPDTFAIVLPEADEFGAEVVKNKISSAIFNAKILHKGRVDGKYVSLDIKSASVDLAKDKIELPDLVSKSLGKACPNK